jgi:hypothetical protein
LYGGDKYLGDGTTPHRLKSVIVVVIVITITIFIIIIIRPPPAMAPLGPD